MNDSLLEVPGYAVEGVLGSGGFGTVYRARRRRDDFLAAIKVSHPGQPRAGARLAFEAEVLRRLGAPTAPAVLEQGLLPSGQVYLAMELVALPTLGELLGQGAMPIDAFGRRALAVLRALDRAHAAGVVHRDLKPDNVFVADAPPLARLVDFGVARVPLAARESEEDAAAGTAEYMAPEQVEGSAEVDARADLYATGVLLYEMLTGRRPFEGSAAELHQAHLSRRPAPLPPSVPGELAAVVMRCLEKERDRRYASAPEVAEAIQQALLARAAPPAAEAPEPASRAPPTAASRKRSMALVFAESAKDSQQVQSAAASYAGKVAHLAGPRFVLAFDDEASENPLRRALLTAQTLLARGLCSRALVDLAQVTVVQRRQGLGYLSPLFTRAERYPRPQDAAGILLSEAASALLPDVAVERLLHREGYVALAPAALGPETQVTLFPGTAQRLFGREQALQGLLRSAQEAVREPMPTLGLVLGAPGMGKSAFAASLLRRLREVPGAQVWGLRAREPLGGATPDLTRQLLRVALALPHEAPPESGRAFLTERLPPSLGPEAWAAVALALGWLAPDAPELAALSAAPGVLRSLTVRALGEALRRQAALQPLLLVIDDAHFADDITLDALELATLAEAEVPLWALLLSRPGFPRATEAFGERAGLRTELTLDALAPDDAVALVRELLLPAENVPGAVLGRLLERTRRVPLLLVELVRALKAEGLVRENPDTGYWSLSTEALDRQAQLPLVEWVTERTLSGLSADLRAHAELAASLGADFLADELDGVLRALEQREGGDEYPLDARVGLQRLRARELLVKEANGRYAFRTALLREAIARGVPPAKALRLHRAACRFYAGTRLLPPSEQLPRLAEHAERAQDLPLAARLRLLLAEDARQRHAYLEAELGYTRALALVPSDDVERRLQAFRGRGQMRYRVGRFAEALEDIREAQRLAASRDDVEARVSLVLEEATALDWVNEYAQSQACVERAQALLRGPPAPQVEAALLLCQGRSSMRFGRFSEAVDRFGAAAARAEAVGDAAYETLVVALLLRAPMLAMAGHLDEAEVDFERVISLCEQRGDQLHLGSAIQNRVLLHAARRDGPSSLRDTTRFLELSRELGLLSSEYRAEVNLAELAYQLGEVALALAHCERAIVLARRLMGPTMRPDALLLRARIYLYAGEPERARALLEALMRDQAEAKRKGWTPALLLPAEALLAAMVDLATSAHPSEEAWDDLVARARALASQADPIEVVEMRAAAAERSGQRERARALYDEALATAATSPNLMEARLRRALARLGE